MKRVQIKDKEFGLFIPYEKINGVVESLAERMNHDLSGKKPLFIGVLNGSFMFAAELFRRIELTGSEISFVKLCSYHGDKSAGKISELIGLKENIEGRTVVIIEDIVDTGVTIDNLIGQLEARKPQEVMVATLLLKPEALVKKVRLDYVGLEIPNDFVVGYGLDYDGQGRNLPDLYSLIK